MCGPLMPLDQCAESAVRSTVMVWPRRLVRAGRDRQADSTGFTEVARGEIGAFLEREWTAENVYRFAAADSRPQWAWRGYCVGAYENGEMVGAAVFRVRGGLGHLSNVISTRTRRGQGFGSSQTQPDREEPLALDHPSIGKLMLRSPPPSFPVA